VRRPRAAPVVPRGVRLPEERAAIFHIVHCRLVFVYGTAGAAHPPVPGVDGGCGQDPGKLADDPIQLPDGKSGRPHSEFFHPNDFENLKKNCQFLILFCCMSNFSIVGYFFFPIDVKPF